MAWPLLCLSPFTWLGHGPHTCECPLRSMFIQNTLTVLGMCWSQAYISNYHRAKFLGVQCFARTTKMFSYFLDFEDVFARNSNIWAHGSISGISSAIDFRWAKLVCSGVRWGVRTVVRHVQCNQKVFSALYFFPHFMLFQPCSRMNYIHYFPP